jgi:hypothetical protein
MNDGSLAPRWTGRLRRAVTEHPFAVPAASFAAGLGLGWLVMARLAAPAATSRVALVDLTRAVAGVVLVLSALAAAALLWAYRRWRRTGDARIASGRRPARAFPVGAAGNDRWMPQRMALGQSVKVRYDASEPAFRSWLVYDAGGDLVGGAGLQGRMYGNVGTLDVWVFRRQDDSGAGVTPVVTIVTPAACADPVFGARFAGRRLLTAVPGETVSLDSDDLVLHVRVDSADPGQGADERAIALVTLTLTPRHASAGGDA